MVFQSQRLVMERNPVQSLPVHNLTPFPFLRLPSELRNTVYEHTLSSDCDGPPMTPKETVKLLHSKYALACVNKQMRREYRPLYIDEFELVVKQGHLRTYMQALKKSPGIPRSIKVDLFFLVTQSGSSRLNIMDMIEMMERAAQPSSLEMVCSHWPAKLPGADTWGHEEYNFHVARSVYELVNASMAGSSNSTWRRYLGQAVASMHVTTHLITQFNHYQPMVASYVEIGIKKKYQTWWMGCGDQDLLRKEPMDYPNGSHFKEVKDWVRTTGFPGKWGFLTVNGRTADLHNR